MERASRPLSPYERVFSLALFALSPLVAFPARVWRSSFMDGGDASLHNLPLLTHSARAALEGSFFWSASTWMGTPLLEEPELATFYPPKLLFAVIASPVLAYGAYVYLHYVLAQLAGFLYARTIGLSFGPALVTAVTYGLTAFMVGHQGHTMYVVAGAWAPLFLAATYRYTRAPEPWSLLAAIAAFAMLPLAGAFQLAFYLAVTTLMISLGHAWLRGAPAVFARGAACVVLGLFAGAIQILPSLVHSASLEAGGRTDFVFSTEHSLEPAAIATLVMRPTTITAEGYVFVGASVLVASVLGLAYRRSATTSDELDRLQRLWALVAGLAGLLMLGRYLPLVTRALHALPVIGIFRAPIRHEFEVGIALSVLAGIAAERGLPRAQTLRAAGVAAAALAGLFALHRIAAAAGVVLPENLVSLEAGAVAVLAGGLAALCLARGWWVGLVAIFLAEIVFVQVHAGWGRPDHLAGLEEARAHVAAARARVAEPRFLTPSFYEGTIGNLGGNTTMLFQRVGHLHGYASMAPRDAALVLELDEFGVEEHPEALVYSQLPEIFGVTDVIGPPAALGSPTFRLAEGSCRSTSRALAASRDLEPDLEPELELSPGTPVRCEGTLTEGRRTLVVEGSAGDRLKSLERALRRGPWTRDRFVALGGRTPLDDLERTRLARLDVVPPPPADAESYLVETELAELVPGPRGLTLASSGGPLEVHAQPLAWPRSTPGPFTMEAAVSGSFEGQLVLDLYADGYDPDDAQLVLREPGRFTSSFEREPPEDARWRAFLEGRGTARVEQSAILAPRETRRLRLRDGGTLYVAAIRPLEIVAQLLNRSARAAEVTVAILESEGSSRTEPLAPGESRALRWMAPVPATATQLTLEASAAGAPVSVVIEVREAPRAARRLLALGTDTMAHYVLPDSLPRVYAATHLSEASLEATREALLSEDFQPGRDAIVDRPPPATDLHPARLEATFEPERLRIEVDAAEGPAFVVVNDRFDERWRATLDGAPTPILRVNGLVRGVEVPRGHHVIEMRFPAPRAFLGGLLLLLVALVLASISRRWEPQLSATLERRLGRERASAPDADR